jgi:hypothetical protein
VKLARGTRLPLMARDLGHRPPLRMVVPGAAVSVPVVYLAMRIVHLLVPS